MLEKEKAKKLEKEKNNKIESIIFYINDIRNKLAEIPNANHLDFYNYFQDVIRFAIKSNDFDLKRLLKAVIELNKLLKIRMQVYTYCYNNFKVIEKLLKEVISNENIQDAT